jgi:hypothetical protein
MDDIVIKMTPFIFENGNTYYFKIVRRDGCNDYHDLYVYKKVTIKKKFLWWNWENVRYDQLNESGEMVSVKLDTSEVKREIHKIIIARSAVHQLKGWDGFVGNVPEELKKSLQRDSKLNDLFGE